MAKAYAAQEMKDVAIVFLRKALHLNPDYLEAQSLLDQLLKE